MVGLGQGIDLMHFDKRFEVIFFAKDLEWRVYVQSGTYITVKGIDDIPRAVRSLLADEAEFIKRVSKNPCPK